MGAQTQTDQSYSERAAAATRELSDWFDAKYARPTADAVQQSWFTRPISTTFLVILCAISIVPVLMFLLFSILVSATFIVVGLGIALVAAASVIAFTGFFLLCLLVFLVFVAVGLTLLTLSSLSAYRLLVNVRGNGVREGTANWVEDTRGRLRGARTQTNSSQSPQKKGTSTVELSPVLKEEFITVGKEQ